MNGAELYRFCVKVTETEGILGKAFTLGCMRTDMGEVKCKSGRACPNPLHLPVSHEESTISTNCS